MQYCNDGTVTLPEPFDVPPPKAVVLCVKYVFFVPVRSKAAVKYLPPKVAIDARVLEDRPL